MPSENAKEIMAENTNEYDPTKKTADRLRIKQKRDNMDDTEKAISKKKNTDRMKKVRDCLNKDEIELIGIFKQEITGMPSIICDVCKKRILERI